MKPLYQTADPLIYKIRDPNEHTGTSASKNYCLCGKPDYNVPGMDWDRIEHYKCETCLKKK